MDDQHSTYAKITAQEICDDYQARQLRKPVTTGFDQLDTVTELETDTEELSEPEDVKDLIISDSESLSSDSESDDESDLNDFEWPGFIDRVIHQFSGEYTIVQQLMNLHKRKVYTAVRDVDDVSSCYYCCGRLASKAKQERYSEGSSSFEPCSWSPQCL